MAGKNPFAKGKETKMEEKKEGMPMGKKGMPPMFKKKAKKKK